MQVKQIYELVNQAMKETIGETAILSEDLSNLVDCGNAVIESGSVDNYGKTISNLVGKTIFVTRQYQGRVPSLRKDAWEYGSILRKIRAVPLETEENDTWKLTKGTSYDPNVFKPAETHEKFFNKRTTFQVQISLTEIQIKESFQSKEQMNSFLSMIETTILNSFTKDVSNLAMRTVNNMVAETLYSETYDSEKEECVFAGRSGNKAVNLLYLYNTKMGTTLTADKAINDKEFIRFSSYILGLYSERISDQSKLFNMGGTLKFTPADRLKMILLTDFKQAANAYLQSDTFHDQYTKLPGADTITYWQGSGLNYDFDNTSKINVVTADGHSVATSGIIGVMFDEDACMITNDVRRTTTGYNPVGEFYNYWHKMDCQYLNDYDENFIVFYIA